MRNILITKSCRKTQKHILSSVLFSENYAVYETMKKNMRELEATDVDMAHALCMLHK
jgi:hypothetical protein